MKTVLVTGGAGGVGYATSCFLTEAGYAVTALIAPWDDPARRAALERRGVRVVIGDIRDRQSIESVFSGCDTVVHAAALLPSTPASMTRPAQHSVNVAGAETILRLAVSHGVRRAVFISTAGVASHYRHGVELADESSPYRRPQNAHIWSKIEAEKMLFRVSAELGLGAFVLRPVSIYGGGMSFRWPEIVALIRAGKMRLVGNGNAPYPLIHVRDLARAIERAIAHPGIDRTEAVIVSSDEALTLVKIVESIREYFHAPPIRHVPFPVALLGAYCISALPLRLRPGTFRHVTPESIREYQYGHLYRTDKAKRVLGFVASTAFADGLREMLSALEKKYV